MNTRIALCVFLCLAVFARAAENDVIPGCGGQLNDKPVVDVPAQFIRSVSNGQKYLIKSGTDYVYIVKVSGTPHEMGQAFGDLMQDEISENAAKMYKYLGAQMEKALSDIGFPESIIQSLFPTALKLFNWVLDLNWWIAEPYTPRRYDEEMRAIALGSNGKVDYETLRRINMIPELTQAACTIIGAWGPATEGGKLLELRALDWSSDAPVNQFPSIVIYNSTEVGSGIFANVGYAGLIGSITAVSKDGIGIAEKVWYPPKSMQPHPRITYFGKPWTFVLRDLAQFAHNIDQMLSQIYTAKRTMRIHIGLGSRADNSFRGLDYSANVVDVFTDTNYTDYTPQHPQMNGIFYFDKHVQPSNNECVGNILKMNYGKITPATLYREVAGFHQTGNTQMCAMDLTNNEIWLSYSEFGTNVDAYKRSPIHVKLNDFWGQ